MEAIFVKNNEENSMLLRISKLCWETWEIGVISMNI